MPKETMSFLYIRLLVRLIEQIAAAIEIFPVTANSAKMSLKGKTETKALFIASGLSIAEILNDTFYSIK